MLKFALKNMAIKKMQVILITLSIVISAGIAVLAFNVATQVDEGITSNAGYYSAIVGPAGSNTQLAMNSMYFTDEPVGTMPYSVVTSLQQDSRVTQVIRQLVEVSKGKTLIAVTHDDRLAKYFDEIIDMNEMTSGMQDVPSGKEDC